MGITLFGEQGSLPVDGDGVTSLLSSQLTWCSLCFSPGMAELRGILLLLLYMSHSSSAGECAAPSPGVQ